MDRKSMSEFAKTWKSPAERADMKREGRDKPPAKGAGKKKGC